MELLPVLVLVGLVVLILAIAPARSQPDPIVVIVPQEQPTFGCTFLILVFLLIVIALVSFGR